MGKAILLSASAPRLIIDPSHSDLLGLIPGVANFRDPTRWPLDAATARFVPADPGDLDAYDELYRRVWIRMKVFVFCDELGIVMPARGASRWCRTVVIAGRKRSIGHWGCHTRPREVDPNCIAQAQHVITFDLANPDDRRRLAELCDLNPADLAALLGRLGEHEFLWLDRRQRTLTSCPPLR